MKTKVLILSLLSMLAIAVNADIVSVNFNCYGEPEAAVSDGYGVEPADNWFELVPPFPPPQFLQETDLPTSNGKTSTIDFSISGGEWDRFEWGDTWLYTPMASGIGSAGTVTLTLSDMDGTFPNEYDVIVYVTGWGGWGTYTDGTTTYYCSVTDPRTAELIQCTDTDPSDGMDQGTYVRFNDLSADTTIIQILNPIGGSIGGFQIFGSERGMAYSLSPTGVVSRDFDEHELTWASADFPDDPNLTLNSMDLVYYKKRTEDVTEDDPNFSDPNILTTVPGVTSPRALTFDYDTVYFWRIDSHVIWDVIDITGNLTETIPSLPVVFEVEARQVPPKVYIEPDGGRTWLDKPISLPTMVKDVDNLTFKWAVTGPESYTGDPKLFLTGTTMVNTGGGVWQATPVFTPTGTDPEILGEYTITLTADDGPTDTSDTMWITVHETPCDTFQASDGLLLPFDGNGDCVIDIEDAVMWASAWLEDINPEGPIYIP